MSNRSLLLMFAAIVGLTTLSVSTSAGDVPDYDFQWATIGDPGNAPYSTGLLGGDVDYVYRMSVHEVTNGQYIEFLHTFAPQMEESDWGRPSGGAIVPTFGHNQYILNPNLPHAADMPVTLMSWRFAAMYVNWLHNGKSTDVAAIMDGAYDASTFGFNDDGTFTDQVTRSPDATFWIPSMDEWMKAAYYDPDRHGSGEGGWWMYPDGSDTPLVSGDPGVGQTSAGSGPFGSDPGFFPVGSYPDVQSPWGLLDMSGSATEWTEAVDFGPRSRYIKGAAYLDPVEWDCVCAVTAGGPRGNIAGLRVASAVSIPSPYSLPVLMIYMLIGSDCRNRRKIYSRSDIQR